VTERAFLAFAVASFAVLAFLAGSFVILAQRFPYEPLRSAYVAAKALMQQHRELGNAYATDLWHKAPTARQGVTVIDPERMQPGYTLYSSAHTQAAFLIGPDGKVAHAWSMPYSQVWDRSAATQHPVADNRTYFRDVRLLPNGELLAVYDGVGDALYGYGLIKLDKDSHLVWKYLQHVHHTVDVAPHGNVFILTQAITTDEFAPRKHLKPPRIDDYVVELSPSGTPIREVRVLDALARSDYLRLTDALPGYLGDSGDYLHTNDIEYIDAGIAQRFPFAQPGQVLLSMREPGAIAVLDLNSRRITWAMRGFWVGQHDPDLLPNGHMMLFDNNGHFGAGGRSQVVEFDPINLQVFWRYTGDARRPLESVIRASQQRLANGNTLITESDQGRLLEVSPSGDIVWEFVNPMRAAGADGEMIPIVSSGQRIDPEQLTPEFRQVLETNNGGPQS
jgi:hypothetical protein